MSKPGDSAERAEDRIGTIVAHRFKLVASLGVGGIGAVYKAHDLMEGHHVALKLLRKEYSQDREVVARFEREANAMTALVHEHIVRAIAFGRSYEGELVLVMELVEGETLRTVLARKRPPDIALAVEVSRQLGAALHCAHKAGVVHRDLKPENVMVTWKSEGHPHIKVLDFGMARIVGGVFGPQSPLTRKGAVFGTPEYMSPEQASGRPVDKKADQYSMGVIVFEMLAGKRPFAADTPLDLLQMQIHDLPPSLIGVNPRVPEELEPVVRRMLAKKATDRFDDVDDAGRALVSAYVQSMENDVESSVPSEDRRHWWQIFSNRR